ncbi:hypothetical protein J4H41_17830 [Vibrio alginolyticus]|uniref:hypothetical protein n=1 Tax=Vibrio alginolyticus TaxID=663 RepID=UPI001BD4635C|nr:hypothetical protein [Vibrio alginolyticus]MBS9898121.1 hypothetical protein [Vibrio alginolyticus]
MRSFSEWLKSQTALTVNVINDTNSRLNRVKRIIGDVDSDDLNVLLEKLENEEAFLSLSRTVKSQLRRALKLYCEFRRSALNE